MVVTAAISQDDASSGAKAIFCAENGVCSGASTASKPRISPISGNSASQNSATALGLSYWIDLQLPNGELARVSADKRFSTGDRIRLSLRPNRSGYLYLFNLGTSSRMTPLFPRGEETARTEAGQTVSVPARNFLRFSGPPGEEQIVILFSPTPLPEFSGGRQAGMDSSTVIASAKDGGKDLMREDDFDASDAIKANIAVLRPGSESKAIHLTVRLKHQ